VSGLLVDSHDPADFAAAIARVVTAPRHRARLSAGARRHAERFSWQRTAEGLLHAYRGALDDASLLRDEAAEQALPEAVGGR
jgi:D-inositol-3-phosphate glycosyltransferase